MCYFYSKYFPDFFPEKGDDKKMSSVYNKETYPCISHHQVVMARSSNEMGRMIYVFIKDFTAWNWPILVSLRCFTTHAKPTKDASLISLWSSRTLSKHILAMHGFYVFHELQVRWLVEGRLYCLSHLDTLLEPSNGVCDGRIIKINYIMVTLSAAYIITCYSAAT